MDLLGGANYCTQTCINDNNCEFGDGNDWTCVNTGPGGNLCLLSCDTQACPAEHECYQTGVGGLCASFQGQLCDSQADCDPGEICTLAGNGDNNAYISYCSYPDNGIGDLSVGDVCDPNLIDGQPCLTNADCPADTTCNLQNGTCEANPDTQCGTFICWTDGYCGGPCTQDSECPTDMVCAGYEFRLQNNTPDDPLDDVNDQVNYCTPFPGSRNACDIDADCPTGEVCSSYSDTSLTFTKACRTAEAPDAALGEACTDDPATIDVREDTIPCETGTCLGAGTGCTAFCDVDADCGAGFRCLDLAEDSAGQPVGYCVAGADCTTDADCDPGDICGLRTTVDGYINNCTPAAGGIAPLGQCNPDLPFVDTVACNDNADCAAVGDGSWVCDALTFQCAPSAADTCALGGCFAAGDTCPAVCGVDGDCGTDYVCAGLSLLVDTQDNFDPTDDTGDTIAICQYLPGSGTACTTDADCAVADEYCVVSQATDGTLTPRCSSAGLGDTGVVNGDCGEVTPGVVTWCVNSGACNFDDGRGLDRIGTCSALCTTNAECAVGQTCVTEPLGPEGDGLTISRCEY